MKREETHQHDEDVCNENARERERNDSKQVYRPLQCTQKEEISVSMWE